MTSTAGWIMAISVMVIALAMTVGLVAAVLVVRKSVNRLLDAAQPAMRQAHDTIKTVNGIAETVRHHADDIGLKVEGTMDDLSQKVRSTTDVIEETVRPPLVGAASLIAGVSEGLKVWSNLSKRKGGDSNGK